MLKQDADGWWRQRDARQVSLTTLEAAAEAAAAVPTAESATASHYDVDARTASPAAVTWSISLPE